MARPFPPHPARTQDEAENGLEASQSAAGSGGRAPAGVQTQPPPASADAPHLALEDLTLEDPQLEEYEQELDLRRSLLDYEALAPPLPGLFGEAESNGHPAFPGVNPATGLLDMSELLNDVDDDPLAALQAAIEQDRPSTQPSPEWEAMLRALEEDPTAGELVDARPAHPGERAAQGAGRFLGDAAAIQEGAEDAPGAERADRGDALSEQRQGSEEAAEGGALEEQGGEPLDDEGASPSDIEAQLSALERLQPACTQLLASHGDQLHSILEELGPSEVAACSDSPLFPLLLTLDREMVAAGSVDAGGPVDPGAELATAAAAQSPRTMHASNAVVEAALRCLRLVLASLAPHSTLKGTPSLVAAMLPRLAAVLAWPEASEEALQLTVACLGQLLLARAPGAGEDAMAGLDGPSAEQLQHPDKNSGKLDSAHSDGAEEAVPASVAAAWATAFFRAPDGPMHFGHLCSSLLQVSARQLSLANGDRALAAQALWLLARLVESGDQPDVLAYFLPGILSGLARQLRQKSPARLNAAGATAALEAVSGLLRQTLDQTDPHEAAEAGPSNGSAAPSAVEQLRRLAARQTIAAAPAASQADARESATVAEASAAAEAAAAATGPETENAFIAHRDRRWRGDTVAKTCALLTPLLPALSEHASPGVRGAAAGVCEALLVCGRGVLSDEAARALTGCLGVLGQDAWPGVARQAQRALRRWVWRPAASPDQRSQTGQVLVEFGSLAAAFQRGSEHGTAQALRLASLLAAAPPGWVVETLILDPGSNAVVLRSLMTVLRVEPEIVPLSSGAQGFGVGVGAEVATRSEVGALANSQLPRQPWAAACVTTSAAWRAIAAVAGELGSCAAAAAAVDDSSLGCRAALGALLEPLLAALADEPGAARADADDDAFIDERVGVALRRVAALTCAGAILAGVEVTGDGRDDFIEKKAGSPSPASPARDAASVRAEAVAGLVRSFLDVLATLAPWEESVASPEAQSSKPSLSPADLVIGEVGQEATGALDVAHPFSAASLAEGASVLLQRSCWDFVAVAASALGARFAGSGGLMRLVLLPLLQSLEAGPLVREAAGIALQALVRASDAHKGRAEDAVCLDGESSSEGSALSGVAGLVASNADYLVDGLCRQLRQPGRFPQAPRLFAGLLRQTGVPATLLPLLAEPVRIAVQSLGVFARTERPENTLRFVEALGEVVRGSAEVAAAARRGIEAIADDVQRRWEAAVRERAQQRADADGAGSGDEGSVGSDSVEEEPDDRADGRFGEAEAYFRKRLARRAARAAEREHPEGAVAVPLDPGTSAALRRLRRQVHAAAALASSVCDASGVLVHAKSLPLATTALAACLAALRVLCDTTAALDAVEKRVEAQSVEDARAGPAPPQTPRMLPSVHLLWEPLMAGLEDERVPLVEAVLEALGDVCKLAGCFLAQRFAKAAWPRLRARLERGARPGPSPRGASARQRAFPGHDVPEAPAATLRLRCGVCALLGRLADGLDQAPDPLGGGGAQEVVLGVLPDAMSSVADFLNDSGPVQLRESATKAFMALAGLRPSVAVRLLDAALGRETRDAVEIDLNAGSSEMAESTGEARDAAGPSAASPLAVPDGLRRCNARKLEAMRAKLLEQVPGN